MATGIDTLNKFLVGVQGDRIVILRQPLRIIPDDALNLAAYLVALAEPNASHAFADVLHAVQNT